MHLAEEGADIVAVDLCGQIDVRCANAGVFSFAPFTELTDGLWDDMIGVTLTDISRAVAWLASDESRYVTGICLPVDAGFHEKVG